MNNIIITTSWDDGHPLDLKLKNILKRYNIPATFYIPIRNRERDNMSFFQIKNIAREFDVGAHTYNHINLTTIPLELAKKEIIEGKMELENIIDREITMFCYPKGAYNNKIIEVVKKVGFNGARTTHIFSMRIKNIYKLGSTITAKNLPIKHYINELIKNGNYKLFLYLTKHLNKFSLNWDQIARRTLEYVNKWGGVWHLRGHSWEIELEDDWGKLEEIFAEIEEIAKTHSVTLIDNSKLALKYLNKLH